MQQDLAARLGRLLREVGTPSDVAALDCDYASGKELNEGLRLATLEASSATSVLHRALTDAEPSIAVKESALRRLSELGESGTLRDVLRDTTQSATVRISTLQELGRVAAEPRDLEELVDMGAQLHMTDELGRLSSNMARVAASESAVGGKARVLFRDWSALLDRLSAGEVPISASECMVLSIALARALWSDPDRSSTEGLIREELVPTLTQRLTRAQERRESVVLQVLVEFGAAYVHECELRPEPVCEVADDSRSVLRGELAEIFAPFLADPELADVAGRLRI